MTRLVSIARQARAFLGRASAGLALLAVVSMPVSAQPVPSSAGIDGDLVRPDGIRPAAAPMADAATTPYPDAAAPTGVAGAMGTGPATSLCGRQTATGGAYQPDDLIGAAEGVFGTGARGLAALIRDILHKQGAPDGYIGGREAGGAFAVGIRYGSGVLCQKVQGPQPLPVYWTGPSLGFDAGASAAKTFVLVYNLNNHDDLFRRFGAGEGQAYLVGGFNVSYLRRGNVVLIPVRMGVGLRLGINAGYMKFTRHQTWLPF